MRLTIRLSVYACALLLFAFSPRLAGQSAPAVTILHNFSVSADGANPFGPMVQGSDGNLYGTTSSGGNGGVGTVFQITPAGGFTTLYNFTGAVTDGSGPHAGLVQGSDGNFYGTTTNGGASGAGTVFRITPAGVLTALHSFSGTDGYDAMACLVQGNDGRFYGTTALSASGFGTVFQVTQAGLFTTLDRFASGMDGANPAAPLVQGIDSNFYGTTGYGGSGTTAANSGNGTIFQVTPAGALTILHRFTGTDGEYPGPGLAVGSDGNFYGATNLGGSRGLGTVFQITPAGGLTTLYNFSQTFSDGEYPSATMVLGGDGDFYGTTSNGGAGGYGTIFQITPAGVLTALDSFTGIDASSARPDGVVQASDGNFYGTTITGGSNYNGMIYRLSRNFGAPMVLVQPSSQLVTVGQTATLSAYSSGASPLSYQWRLNGANISGATNATLAIPNAQQTNSGSYSVVVSNGVAPAAISQESRLAAYAPAAGQQPAGPTQSQTSQALSVAQAQQPRTPASSQLGVLNSTASIDPTKMTIVMTHGWNSSASAWPASMGSAFKSAFDAKANILAWDWSADAAAGSAAFAASRAPNQGRALGQALVGALGSGYNLPIHFIGSGIGGLVNCEAANYIHGDNRSKGDTTPTYSFWNIQMTMLDEAGDLINSLLNKSDTVTNRWANAIPNRSAWVDNYVSQPGYLPSKAANVLLYRNAPNVANGYASSWYQETVSNPAGSLGDAMSFEQGTLTPSQLASPEDTYFLQSSDANASDQLVSQISKAPAWHYDLESGAIILPSAAYQALYPSGSALQNLVPSAIQYSDNLATNIIQGAADVTGAAVYLDQSGSTPAYVTASGSSSQSANQAVYGMQLTMQPPAASSAVYSIIPVTIPNEAVGVSFEYQMTGAADTDFLSMGVAAENDFTMEGAYVTSGAWNGTPVIPVSSYHGQSTQLVFAMNGSNGPPGGTLSVRNIRFLIPPRPQLSLAMNGASLTVSWPVNAPAWTLQSTATLSDPSSWQTVNGAPVDTALSHTMTLNMASKSQFFRLMK